MLLICNFCNKVTLSNKMFLKEVFVSNSKPVISLSYFVYKAGYIFCYKILSFKYISILNKFNINGSCLRGMFSLSKPSKICYLKYKDIINSIAKSFANLNGFMIFSTSKGYLISDIECALMKTGGTGFVFVG